MHSQTEIWAQWEERAHTSLVTAMRQRGMGYKELSRELEKLGIFETPGQLNRKVNRRKFSAAFYQACLQATVGDADAKPIEVSLFTAPP